MEKTRTRRRGKETWPKTNETWSLFLSLSRILSFSVIFLLLSPSSFYCWSGQGKRSAHSISLSLSFLCFRKGKEIKEREREEIEKGTQESLEWKKTFGKRIRMKTWKIFLSLSLLLFRVRRNRKRRKEKEKSTYRNSCIRK